MKKHLLLLATLFVGLTACNKQEIEHQGGKPQEQGESVVVSLAMAGDITITETPLAKAAGAETEARDIYGISVYYDKDKDGQINDVYGYGLFDNVADMKISLLTGYKYKFVCSMVKDGKDKLGVYTYFRAYNRDRYSKAGEAGYGYPFGKSNTTGYCEDSYEYMENNYLYSSYGIFVPVKNEFILGDGYHLTGLGNGATHDIENYSSDRVYSHDYTSYPKTERYYGEVTDYAPTQGGKVSINMKKCVFGLKVNVNGLTDGKLSLRLNENFEYHSNKIVAFSNLETDGTVVPETIFTFNDIYDCWVKGAYSLTSNLHITWTRGNNVTQTLETRPVTLKRNVLTTININLVGSSSDNGFNLDLEDDAMKNEDADLDYNAGDITETPVEPTE